MLFLRTSAESMVRWSGTMTKPSVSPASPLSGVEPADCFALGSLDSMGRGHWFCRRLEGGMTVFLTTGEGGSIPGTEGECAAAEFLGVAFEDRAGGTATGAVVGAERGISAGAGFGVLLEAAAGGRMKGWLKKTSNSKRSLAFLLRRPFSRSASSGDVPLGIL